MEKSKRRWNWTKENLRKTRSYNHKLYYSAPKRWFLNYLDEQEKTKSKKALNRFIRHDEEYLHLDPRTSRSKGKWYWW